MRSVREHGTVTFIVDAFFVSRRLNWGTEWALPAGEGRTAGVCSGLEGRGNRPDGVAHRACRFVSNCRSFCVLDYGTERNEKMNYMYSLCRWFLEFLEWISTLQEFNKKSRNMVTQFFY